MADHSSVDIENIQGGVIAGKIAGTGNIAGKEVKYTVKGNVINIGSISKESLEVLRQTQVIPSDLLPSSTSDELKKDPLYLQRIQALEKRIDEVLVLLEKTKKETGTNAEMIRVGDLVISHSDLLMQEAIIKGNEYYFNGNFSMALNYYDQAIKIAPNNPQAWHAKGVTHGNIGQHFDAMMCFRKVLEIDPSNVQAWYCQSLAFGYMGQHHDAIQGFNQTLTLQPLHVDAWYFKGKSHGFLAQHYDAMMCFRKVLELAPNHPYAWYDLGVVFGILGNHRDAIMCLDRTISLFPNHAYAWYFKGVSLANLGEQKKAKECFDRAISLGLVIPGQGKLF